MHCVTIFSTGYVGLVTGACLADAGNNVLCIDVDKEKIARLNRGEMPICEPGLDGLVRGATRSGRLRFSADIGAGVAHGLFLFIAVGTPPDEDGAADLGQVLAAARSIGERIEQYRVVVVKSTVPAGTADRVGAEIGAALARRGVACEFDVVSNPEFLKEGAAIEDFMKPARIVVGTDSPRAAEMLRGLYQPFNRNHDRLLIMDPRSAELTKYAANAMLATRISFMNEMANLAELVGADIEQVRVGIGSDPRIGHAYIYSGAGYGGSCLPKDISALTAAAGAQGYRLELLAAVERVNDRQRRLLFEKIRRYFGAALRGKTIALWGLAFKPNTDDLREAPSRVLMEALWDAGAAVRAYDPVAMDAARLLYPDRGDLHLCERAEQAIKGADALAIVTEWREFNSPDFDLIKSELAEPVIFDGRNLYDPGELKRRGIRYFGIGRGQSVAPISATIPRLHRG